jgi:antitoxin component YwqK of YwqJK toxin-antitoxin module
MKNEQDCGRSLSRLGLPSISIIGQFSESILFKDTFDDHAKIVESKTSMKASYSFCKWKIIRKVFNEIGVSHAETALFYKDGVLSNIKALQDNVQNNVRNLQ